MSSTFERALDRFDKAAQRYGLKGSYMPAETIEIEREYEAAKSNLRAQRKL